MHKLQLLDYRSVRIVLLALVLALWGTKLLDEARFAGERIGIYIDFESGWLVVDEVEKSSPARQAGVRAGDQLLAVDDQTMAGFEDFESAIGEMDRVLDRVDRGDAVAFTIKRDDETVELSLTPGMPIERRFYSDSILVLVYLIVGFLALRKGPGYLNAHLLFVLCYLIAMEMALTEGSSFPDQSYIALILFWSLLTGIQMGVEFHLASAIPEPASWANRHRWIILAFYMSGLLFALVLMTSFLSVYSDLLASNWFWETMDRYLVDAGMSVWAVGLLAILVARAVTYREPEGRRQAGVVALGLLPWAVYVWMGSVLRFLNVETPAEMTETIESLALLFFPLAILFVLWREGQNQERMLIDLSGQIQEASGEPEIAALIDQELADAFHPQWVAVFALDSRSGDLSLSHSSGYLMKEKLAPGLFSLADLAKRRKTPFEPRPRLLQELTNAEREWLESQDARLVVPVMGRGRHLVGLILLGPKKSDEPYTPHNKKLLSSLATHVGLALENVKLESDISEGNRVKRQVLSRLEDEGLNVISECPTCGRCYDGDQEVCDTDGARLTLTLPLERVVDERYRIDRLLGKGGMGAVYEATDLRLGRRVAVKVLLADNFTSQDSIKRFEREARICARLTHPGIVATHDYGTTATGGAFLVMDRLEGQTMRAILEQHRRLDPKTAAHWFDQLLDALEAAHARRVIHRDLKPSNVFIGRSADGESRIFLLDFGLARVVQSDVTQLKTLTTPGMMLGTLAYMAPEQLNDGVVDERTDLYAVGVMAIEVLTGSRPFRGESGHSLSLAILENEYVLPGGDGENARLAEVLARCLSKGPWERYAKASELRRDLIPAMRAFAAPPNEPGESGASDPTVRTEPSKHGPGHSG